MSAKRQVKSKMKMAAVAVGLACASLFGAMSTALAWEGDPWFHEWEVVTWEYFRYTTYYDFVTEVDNQF